jgi:hypothetical protein
MAASLAVVLFIDPKALFSPAVAAAPPKAPKITDPKVLFMALHIATVRIIPAEPTNIPPTSITILLYKIPVMAAAIPVREFNNEITTGISAPPIGSTNRIP